MAYKKLIKVSNVCQLLDKSKYPASTTISGITWTNNGDGTVTANGTCTAEYYVAYVLENNLKDKTVIGHKYALFAGNSLATYYPAEVILMFHPRSDGKYFSAANVEHIDGKVGWVLPEGSYSSYSKVELRIRSGATVENLTFKPQLFDLTEMYGAGHEPTTVEQFRQDFPDEMYDYSPRCWLTSYKRVFMTKTKNLFDINSAKKFNGNSLFFKNGNQITVSQTRAGTWTSANVLLDTSLVGKTISVTAFAMTSGLNKTYIRIQWTANNGLASGRNIESNMITGNSFQKLTLTGVVPESPGGDFTNLCIMFYSNTNNYSLESGVTYSATFTNIQLELGDTATDYVPYGIIPSYQRNLTCKTKNLFDISKVTETDTLKVKGNSIYSYQYPVILSDTDTLSIFKSLKPNTNYTMSAVCPYYLGDSTNTIWLVFNNGSRFELFYNHNSGFAQKTFSLTQEQIDNIRFVYFYGKLESEGGPIIWSNIQIEEGNTATDYVPYGHL